jgi:transcriptional regulator with XRE-family HTH domain
MMSANLIREARLRAGLTQRELAARIGRPQSNVARWEKGVRQPSFETLVEVVRACGLEPSISLDALDTSNDAFIWQLLDATPSERLARQVDAANGFRRLRYAAASGGRTRSRRDFDPMMILWSLLEHGVPFVLVGRLAEAVRGSPAVPGDCEVAVCIAEGAETQLQGALKALRGRPWTDSAGHPNETALELRPLESARRWWIPGAGGALAVASEVPGTRGHPDLSDAATLEELAAGSEVPVASLLDLVRIAGASTWLGDRASEPYLRRTLELASDYLPPGARPVQVPTGLEELFAAHGIRAA